MAATQAELAQDATSMVVVASGGCPISSRGGGWARHARGGVVASSGIGGGAGCAVLGIRGGGGTVVGDRSRCGCPGDAVTVCSRRGRVIGGACAPAGVASGGSRSSTSVPSVGSRASASGACVGAAIAGCAGARAVVLGSLVGLLLLVGLCSWHVAGQLLSCKAQ